MGVGGFRDPDSFVERLNLTIRQGSTYLRRRSPCHARGADQLHGHVDLLRCYDNFIRPHRALKFDRETRTPAMQAGLVTAPMNWSDIFTAPAALYAFHVAVVRVPVAVQLMHTSPGRAVIVLVAARTQIDCLINSEWRKHPRDLMYDLKMKQVRIIDLERGGRDMPAAEYYAHIGQSFA